MSEHESHKNVKLEKLKTTNIQTIQTIHRPNLNMSQRYVWF